MPMYPWEVPRNAVPSGGGRNPYGGDGGAPDPSSPFAGGGTATQNADGSIRGGGMWPPGLPGKGGSGLDWLNAAATVGTGIMNYMGGESANTMNAEQAQKNRDFQAAQADIARKWQEQMRGTAYQATMDDMRKAGLNPMLAFQQGSSATPGASQAGSVGNPEMQNTLGPAVNSALTASRTIADLKTADAQQTLLGAQALTQVAQAERETTSSHLNEEQTAHYARLNREKDATIRAVRGEGRARENRSRLDLEYDARERILKQIATGSSAVRDAATAATRGKGPPPPRRDGRYFDEDDMLRAAKGKGVLVP